MVGGEGDDQLWGSGRGAIGGVVVPVQGAIAVCQLWRSGRGAIVGCRCSVLWWGGVTTNFGGVDVVPLITQKLFFAIWGLCWYSFFVVILVVPDVGNPPRIRNTSEITLHAIGSVSSVAPRCMWDGLETGVPEQGPHYTYKGL